MKNIMCSVLLSIRDAGLVMLLFLSGSCESFVEVSEPNSQLTSDAVFENRTTANAAVADLYAQMREGGLLNGKSAGLSLLLGVYADEMVFYGGSSNPSSQFYSNAILPANASILSLWNASYNQVYAANLVLHKTQVSASIADTDKAQFIGEALFVRSMLHFYLASLFGDVPYVTAIDYNVNNTLQRMPYADVMSHVIADLEYAATLLPDEYVTADRARANKSAAYALLARVYLYNNMWAEAANMASAVINNNAVYAFEANLNDTFLRGSTSTILHLASAYEGRNTDEAGYFIFTSTPTSTALTQSLISAFEPGDLRKANWTKSVTNASGTWHHPFKYKQKNDTGASLEFSVVLRLAEQYLIRAEARARQGELTSAREDLDVIRSYAGLPGTTAVTQEEILTAILNERRVELFSERGHRFFDLKRFGLLDEALAFKPGWSATDALWPLPESELLVNPLLTPQNPGY